MIRSILVLFALLLLASCATTSSQMRALPRAPDTLQLAGFTFQRPAEAGWMLASSSQAEIAIIRPGTDLDESFVIQAFIHSLPEFENDANFLKFLTTNPAGNQNPRFEQLSTDSTLIESKYGRCVRINIGKRDLQPVTRSGDRSPMYMDNLNVVCRHHEHPQIAVTFGASHRYRNPASKRALLPYVDQLLAQLSMTGLDYPVFDYLGQQATRSGDYSMGRRLLETALKLAMEKPIAKPEIARVRFNLGRAVGFGCDFPQAETLFKASIDAEIESVGANSNMLSARYFELARLYADQQKYALAIPYFERAIALLNEAARAQDPVGYALVLEDYARALQAEGEEQKHLEIVTRIEQLKQQNSAKQARFVARHYHTECTRTGNLND